MRGPRCLSSSSFAGPPGRADLARGHVRFRVDPAPMSRRSGGFTLSRATPETRHPSPSISNSVELAMIASLRQDTAVDFCNDIRRRASTTSSVQSSRAPAVGRFHPRLSVPLASLGGPLWALRSVRAALAFRAKTGCEPLRTKRRRSRTVQAHSRVGRRSSPPPPRSACEAAQGSHRRFYRGWSRR